MEPERCRKGWLAMKRRVSYIAYWASSASHDVYFPRVGDLVAAALLSR
jgi:hypothetical protein